MPHRLSSLITRAAPLLAAALLALSPARAPAQGAPDLGGFQHDATQPIEISADSLEVRQQEQVAIFSGDVRANQGGVKMRADRIVVTYDQDAEGEGAAGAIRRVRAEGAVLISSRTETAQGDAADYDVASGRIEMRGDVLLTQADNVISGAALAIDLNSGQARIVGGAQTGGSGRVEAIFNPARD